MRLIKITATMIKKENSNNRQQNDSYNNFQIYRDSNGKIYLLKNGFDCTINNTCNNAEKIYIDTNCESKNDCKNLNKLQDISKNLGVIHQQQS